MRLAQQRGNPERKRLWIVDDIIEQLDQTSTEAHPSSLLSRYISSSSSSHWCSPFRPAPCYLQLSTPVTFSDSSAPRPRPPPSRAHSQMNTVPSHGTLLVSRIKNTIAQCPFYGSVFPYTLR